MPLQPSFSQHAKLSVLDKLPGVIFEYTVSPDGSRDFTYLSPRIDELLGLSREELLAGRSVIESFVVPEDRPHFLQVFEHSIALGREFRWEGRVITRNGIIWLSSSANLSSEHDGVQIWHGVMMDITPRKLQEQRVIDSEQRYRTLIDELPLGIGVHRNGIMLYANPYACRIVGASSSAELIGKEVFRFVHPDDLPWVQERVSRVYKGEILPPAEERFIRLDGREITVRIVTRLIIYEGEPSIQYIVDDITEQKREARERQLQELLFTQLFEASPLATTLLDNQGRVTRVNRAFLEVFGYTHEELLGKSLNHSIVPDHLTHEGNDLNSLISARNVVTFETFRLRKDGSKVSVIIYGVPIVMDEEVIGIFGIYVDITGRKKVEEELQTRNVELDNFVYKVSHDLRAPLSSVRGLTNLAQLPGNTDNPMDYLKLIGQKVMQLDNFISDILSHSKNLKLELTSERIDFRKVIEQTFQDLNYLQGAQEIRHHLRIEAGEFFGDPWRISEVFRNLISNAIKYRRFDIPNPTIDIQVEVDSRQATILFRDNGIGIEPANLDRIFEMFYRASEQSEGSGIGLYIVKNAVEKMKGSIEVKSEPGQGTTFTIQLANQKFAE